MIKRPLLPLIFYSEVSMKHIALFFCFIFSFAASANNIIVNGTRFIYPGNEKEITVQLSNRRPSGAGASLAG
jgi:P pilus assembly chaperone PapD